MTRADYKTNLQYRRALSGLSQSKLAEASGVSLRSIQEYEQGRKPINGVAGLTLYKLAKALGVMIEDLLEL
jgi:transcriptional regulator with XRE-family HTH domain